MREERLDLTTPAVVIQTLSQPLGFPESVQNATALTERNQYRSKFQKGVKGLLDRGSALREPRSTANA